MGRIPVSASAFVKVALAFALGASLLATGCSQQTTVSANHVSAPLPGELSKLALTASNLIVHVTAVDTATSTVAADDDLQSLVVPGDDTFSGDLPTVLPVGDYAFTITFFYNNGGTRVELARISRIVDSVVADTVTNVDTTGQVLEYANDDGDAFNNIDELDNGTDVAAANASIALFANTSFVDYIPGNTNAEASNVEDGLNTGDALVTTFTGTAAADFIAATATADVLVIPELESGDLSAAMAADAKAAVAAFVARGGTLLLFSPSTNSVNLANTTFGFALATGGSAVTDLNPIAAAGTSFEGVTATSLPANDALSLLSAASLPHATQAVYADGSGNAGVAQIPFGAGRLVFLGWDWFDAAPNGTQDGGWLEVLLAAADQTMFRPKVALFANTTYVDYIPTNSDAEASNMEDGLTDMGLSVTPFTGITADEIAAAVTGKDVVVIPELEKGDVTPDLDAAAQAALSDYVFAGGTMVVNSPSGALNLLNTVFGLTLTSAGSATTNLVAAAAAGTTFQGGPASLTGFSATTTLTIASLPTGSRALYTDGGANASVVAMPFGAGHIVVLGWDWFNAAPTGATDGGWLAVLNAAVRGAAPTRVALLADTGFVDYIVGNSSSEASNLEGTLTRLLGFPVTTFFDVEATALAAATAGKDVLVIPEQEAGDLSTGMDAAALAVLNAFVDGGGTLVTMYPPSGVNLIFAAFPTVKLTATGTSTPIDLDATAAAGTLFESGPTPLPSNNGSGSVIGPDLTAAGGTSIYTDAASNSEVGVVPVGTGQIILLGWDWFDAAPVGTQDGGWISVLRSSVASGLD
jgi:hypothetical protein